MTVIFVFVQITLADEPWTVDAAMFVFLGAAVMAFIHCPPFVGVVAVFLRKTRVIFVAIAMASSPSLPFQSKFQQ